MPFPPLLMAFATALGLVQLPPPADGRAPAPARSPDGLERTLTVRNSTGLTIRILQSADARSGRFGDNLLGGAPLASGETRRVDLDVGNGVCLFSLQAELASGQFVRRDEVNACRLNELTLTR